MNDSNGPPVDGAAIRARSFYLPTSKLEMEFVSVSQRITSPILARTSVDGSAAISVSGIGSEYTSIFGLSYGRKPPSVIEVSVEKPGFGWSHHVVAIQPGKDNVLRVKLQIETNGARKSSSE